MTEVAEQSAALVRTGRAFAIPMRTRFRGTTVRQGLLVQGAAGWGEFSPFPEYPPAECARWWAACYEAAELGWPTPLRSHIPVNVTVPAVDPEQAAQIVADAGCTTAKVKVAESGQPATADRERLAAVREALGPTGRLRIDANGAWDVSTAVQMVRALERFDLEYVEQPCASLAELAQVRQRIGVPVAADESIRRAEDPMRVRAAGAADIVVLKTQPLGGVRAALSVAENCGLPVVVSSAVETSVGLAAGLALAAALPQLPYACGLGTLSLLESDVCSDPLHVVAGQIEVRRVEVDTHHLHHLQIDAADWSERARAAVAAGAQRGQEETR